MAAADGARLDAARHQVDERLQRTRQGNRKPLADFGIEPVAVVHDLAHIRGNRLTICRRLAEAAANHGQAVVDLRDPRAQSRHQLRRESAPFRHLVEHAGLVEAAHDHQPVNRVTGLLIQLPEHKRGRAPDRHGAEIDLGRHALVVLDLGRAHFGTAFDSREIHVRELDRAFELVTAVAGEKNHGAMRIDLLGGGQALLEEADHLGLVLDDKRGAIGHRSVGRNVRLAIVPWIDVQDHLGLGKGLLDLGLD